MSKKCKRRNKGEGAIRNNNGVYEGAYIVHKKDGTSIRKSFSRRDRNEIIDIIAKLRILEPLDNDIISVNIDKFTNEIKLVSKKKNRNNNKLNTEMLVKDYVDYYLWEHRRKGERGKQIEDTTFSTYIDRTNYIKEYIGDLKIKDLTLDVLEDLINTVHKRTCDTTVMQVRDLLKSMMKYAKKDGIVEENILENENLNLKERKGKKEKQIIQREDVGTFVDYCKNNKYYELLMALFTGTRASELAGMTWNKLDFGKKTIEIEFAYTRIPKFKDGVEIGRHRGFKDLKSTSSYRILSIEGKSDNGIDFIELLKQHKEEQKVLAKKNGKEFKETDWIFTTLRYNGHLEDSLRDRYKKVLNKIKIAGYETLKLHDLRHTFCSIGIMNGIRVEEMKELLGHSNIGVTVDWYLTLDTNKILEASSKAINCMAKYL